jgi:hypothetical protein
MLKLQQSTFLYVTEQTKQLSGAKSFLRKGQQDYYAQLDKSFPATLHYRVHKSPPPVDILRQTNPIYNLQPILTLSSHLCCL